MLESRSGHGQPDALADLGQCERRDRGLQDGIGILEPSRCRLRVGERRQQLAPAGRRAFGEQPQRVLVPACGGGGRPGAHARCRARQDRDGVLVPGVRRDGDVMRVGLGRRAALEQRRRRPGVRREPPAGARRVVDRAAHEGVAHREAPRLRGRSHEACGHERVERVEGLALGDTRHRRDGVGLEVDADDRRGIEDGAHVGRERSALLRERRRHRVRHARELHLARGARDGSPVAEAPGQVLEVEGVAAALEVEQVPRPLGRVGTEEARRRDEVEGCEDELDPAVLTQRTGERDLQTLRSLVQARRERQEDLGGGRTAQQRCDEVDGRRIGPVQVVEDHHERPILARAPRAASAWRRARGGVPARSRPDRVPGTAAPPRATPRRARTGRAPRSRRRAARARRSRRRAAGRPRTPRRDRTRPPRPCRPPGARAPPAAASCRCPARRSRRARPSRPPRDRRGPGRGRRPLRPDRPTAPGRDGSPRDHRPFRAPGSTHRRATSRRQRTVKDPFII